MKSIVLNCIQKHMINISSKPTQKERSQLYCEL